MFIFESLSSIPGMYSYSIRFMLMLNQSYFLPCAFVGLAVEGMKKYVSVSNRVKMLACYFSFTLQKFFFQREHY